MYKHGTRFTCVLHTFEHTFVFLILVVDFEALDISAIGKEDLGHLLFINRYFKPVYITCFTCVR